VSGRGSQSQFGYQHQAHYRPPPQSQYAPQSLPTPSTSAYGSGHNVNANANGHRQHHGHSQSTSQSESPQRHHRESGNLRAEDRQIRPMKRQYDAVDAQNANPFGTATAADTDEHGHRQSNDGDRSNDITSRPKAVGGHNAVRHDPATVSMHKDNEHQQAMVTPMEMESEKEGPPPLKASVRKGAERQMEVFGEWTVRLLHSRDWNHRDEGLKAIQSFLSKREHPDDRQVVRVAAKLILYAVQDRVAGVILSGIETLNVMVTVYGGDGEVGGAEMARSLHSVIQSLVNLLGHSNGRLVDGAGSIVIAMSHRHEALYRAVYGVLVKSMKKPLPKHLSGRGLILLQLLPQLKLPRGSDLSVAMDNLIRLQLTHKTGDVRDVGIQLTAMLYQMPSLRQRLVSYLERADLNDFIKETLNNALFEATGDRSVLERDPKSQKEQSRPSRAMFNTKKPAPSLSTTKRRGHKKAASKRKHNKSTVSGKQRGHSQHRRQQPQHDEQQQQQQGPPDPEYGGGDGRGHDDDEEEEIEEEDVCNFCGLRDPQFVENEENLDLHYWQSCPMLTSCKLCEQVIEIATLHQHIVTECESGIKHIECPKCKVPVPADTKRTHSAQCQKRGGDALKCPLCLKPIGMGPNPWKQHLLTFPGCTSNPRPLSH